MTGWPKKRIIVAGFLVVALLVFVAVGPSISSLGSLAIWVLIITAFGCGFILSELKWAAQIQELRHRMGGFVRTGAHEKLATPANMSTDMAELHHAFDDMVEIGAADEATAKQSHTDRAVLIREVHHRVKNNLQLMSSILSMHIREVPDDATKSILRRIQNRANSLGTVHTDIYQSSVSGELPVANLLHEIADGAEKHATSFGQVIKIDRHIKATNLLPDQAIPFSLLVSEALDAVARVGIPQDVSLHFDVQKEAVVTVCAKGKGVGPSNDAITRQFIGVLAMQLNGILDEKKGDGYYELTFTFPIPATSKPVA